MADLMPEEFDELVQAAIRRGGAASRGITKEFGPPDGDDTKALLFSAGAIALGRQLARSFTPEGVALVNRIVDAAVERVSLEVDTKRGKAVA